MDTRLLTLSGPYVLARVVNAHSDSFPQVLPLATGTNQTTADGPSTRGTSPTQAAYLDLRGQGNGRSPNVAIIVPVAADGQNFEFNMRVYGWRHFVDPAIEALPQQIIWTPILLGQFNCITGDIPTQDNQSNLQCDTITQTYPAAATPSIEVVSPQNDLAAHIVMDLKGSEKLQLTFDAVTAFATLNAYLGFY